MTRTNEDLKIDGTTKSYLEAIGWGDMIDPRESFRDEQEYLGDPTFRASSYSKISDREDGKCYPLYENEYDLQLIRGKSRFLSGISSVMIGAVDSLANYVLGKEIKISAIQRHNAPGEVSKERLDEIQRAIDDAMTHARFCGFFDREWHKRDREDGESLIRLSPCGCGYVDMSFIEPDCLREPAGKRELEDWLQTSDAFLNSWSFGIHSRKDEPHKPLGYHLVFEESGRDWDYVTPDRLFHSKRNVPIKSKRGVSDYYPVSIDVDREMRLRRNMIETSAVQAAIAWVREHAPGKTAQDIQQFLDSKKSGDVSTTYPGGITRTRNVVTYKGPTVLDVAAGLQYKPGPQGSERNPNFLLVAAYALRSIGIRWVFPEYMISGDASNANYSSTIVAESPFVKAREADQTYFVTNIKDLMWLVIHIAAQAGWITGWPVTRGMQEMRRYVEVKVELPEVATRDEEKAARTHISLIDAKLETRETAAGKLGIDWKQEQIRGVETQRPATEKPASSPFGDVANSRPFTEATRLLEALWVPYPSNLPSKKKKRARSRR